MVSAVNDVSLRQPQPQFHIPPPASIRCRRIFLLAKAFARF